MSIASLGLSLGRRVALVDLAALNRPRVKRLLLGGAVLFLVVGVALSLSRNPQVLHNLDWRPALILMLIAVPATIAINAYEFVLTGRLVGRGIALPAAVEITIIGAAANLLPLPGATLVRLAALKAAGASYGQGTKATMIVAGLWAGVAFVFAGAWMLHLGVGPLATAFLCVGVFTWLGSFVCGLRHGRGIGLPVAVSLTKLALVMVEAVRMFLCLSAFGLAASFGQAAALAAAGVVGNAVSIVPAGLGVREAVSAGLAPLVGLGAGAAFLSAALNRLLGLITVVPLALGLILTRRGQAAGKEGSAAAEDGDAMPSRHNAPKAEGRAPTGP